MVADLKRAFPNIQFVATTHSPSIVQSLEANELINLDRISDINPSNLTIDEVSTQVMGVEDERSVENFEQENLSKNYLNLLENPDQNAAPQTRNQSVNDMRPIDKGAVPMVNGAPKTVSDYKDWRRDLIDRIGNYCCYCNMVLNDSPQVEHVIAQDINPTLATDWDNMLLACGPCNHTKSNKPCPKTTHYLPQFHNTHLAFSFSAVRHPI